jgi:hypothetical protein
MHRSLTALLVVALAACSSLPDAADPLSDAPESRYIAAAPIKAALSYAQALQLWHNAEDLNAWIGTKFEYDKSRAMLLSETQRAQSGRLPIYSPEEFFSAPRGVCVDLSRFAVETLRVIDPQAKPAYLLIEFAPVSIRGNTLRLHWLAMYRHQGSFYFFADAKRPGHIAGPYATVSQFIAEYARYRGREVVSFRELDSYERKLRTQASRQYRERP